MSKPKKSWEKRRQNQTIDPKDFKFSEGWFDLCVKTPGQIKGNQFNVLNCYRSDIYLFDSSAVVYIDKSRLCRLFIGPCESSVFIRDCQDCSLIVFTKQLRVRSCKNLKIALYSMGNPVIQDSKQIQLDCVQFGYNLLLSQMKQAGLRPFNNNWWDVHDFTPAKTPNFQYFQYLEDQNFLFDFGRLLPILQIKQTRLVVPLTDGPDEEAAAGIILLVHNQPKLQQITNLSTSIVIYKTREQELPAQTLTQVLGRKPNQNERGVRLFLLGQKQLAKKITGTVIDAKKEGLVFQQFKDQR